MLSDDLGSYMVKPFLFCFSFTIWFGLQLIYPIKVNLNAEIHNIIVNPLQLHSKRNKILSVPLIKKKIVAMKNYQESNSFLIPFLYAVMLLHQGK